MTLAAVNVLDIADQVGVGPGDLHGPIARPVQRHGQIAGGVIIHRLVAAGPAVDHVAVQRFGVRRQDDVVVADPAVEPIGSGAAVQMILALAADQDIVALMAVQIIVALVAVEEIVVNRAAGRRIVGRVIFLHRVQDREDPAVGRPEIRGQDDIEIATLRAGIVHRPLVNAEILPCLLRTGSKIRAAVQPQLIRPVDPLLSGVIGQDSFRRVEATRIGPAADLAGIAVVVEMGKQRMGGVLGRGLALDCGVVDADGSDLEGRLIHPRLVVDGDVVVIGQAARARLRDPHCQRCGVFKRRGVGDLGPVADRVGCSRCQAGDARRVPADVPTFGDVDG
jgi:hypothetical protein